MERDMETDKGGHGKMVTTVKPIRPTHVMFEDDKEVQKFISRVTSPKTAKKGRMNEMMKQYIQQRKK